MSSNHIKSVVLVGASGNAGSAILEALLRAKRFDVTIIVRPESQSKFPGGPKVLRGRLNDASFLARAFEGADTAIFTLSLTFTEQPFLIEAAANAGVGWILPNDWSADGANDALVERVHGFVEKREARNQIEQLGSKYVAVSTGPWTEFSIQHGGFGIDVPNRKVTLMSNTGRFNTSTLEQVGRGVAALLSLPITNEQDPRKSLSHYANSFVYISSLYTTQSELFEAVKHATGTQDSDWSIKHEDNVERLKIARQTMYSGDMAAYVSYVYGNYMGDGLGGDVEAKSAEDRKVLGLEEEDLSVVAKRAVAT